MEKVSDHSLRRHHAALDLQAFAVETTGASAARALRQGAEVSFASTGNLGLWSPTAC